MLPGVMISYSGRCLLARILAVLVLCTLPGQSTPLANPFPRSFTDDPFVDDEKFIEIGKFTFLNFTE